eukprot:3602485-Amphidinium_carterae.1
MPRKVVDRRGLILAECHLSCGLCDSLGVLCDLLSVTCETRICAGLYDFVDDFVLAVPDKSLGHVRIRVPFSLDGWEGGYHEPPFPVVEHYTQEENEPTAWFGDWKCPLNP